MTVINRDVEELKAYVTGSVAGQGYVIHWGTQDMLDMYLYRGKDYMQDALKGFYAEPGSPPHSDPIKQEEQNRLLRMTSQYPYDTVLINWHQPEVKGVALDLATKVNHYLETAEVKLIHTTRVD